MHSVSNESTPQERVGEWEGIVRMHQDFAAKSAEAGDWLNDMKEKLNDTSREPLTSEAQLGARNAIIQVTC